MDVRIGITQSPRELGFESDATAEELHAAVEAALTEGKAVLSLSDNKGKKYLIPTASIGYVEIGSDVRGKVGFVS